MPVEPHLKVGLEVRVRDRLEIDAADQHRVFDCRRSSRDRLKREIGEVGTEIEVGADSERSDESVRSRVPSPQQTHAPRNASEMTFLSDWCICVTSFA